jgi:hypothetical protein
VGVPHAVAEWIAEVVAFLASVHAFVHALLEFLEQKQREKGNPHFLPC